MPKTDAVKGQYRTVICDVCDQKATTGPWLSLPDGWHVEWDTETSTGLAVGLCPDHDSEETRAALRVWVKDLLRQSRVPRHKR